MVDPTPARPHETAHLPLASPPHNHGRTPAAWVTVSLVLLGSVVASLAVVALQPWAFWTGLGVVALGLVVGRVLKMLGFGQPLPETAAEGDDGTRGPTV